jgi:riboflavin synthase
MFTGIIREIGTVVSLERRRGLVELAVAAPHTAPAVQPMDSVAIQGVCLTAVRVQRSVMVFELIPETQRLTALGRLRQGAAVHVEPSLGLTDRFHGHVVLGHIDGLGRVMRRDERRGELVLTIGVTAALRAWLVAKGPVAVNGVSLTVGAKLAPRTFQVHLIPETRRRTRLAELTVGSQVNVEADYLAKVVRQPR